jgi:hypothetical protein
MFRRVAVSIVILAIVGLSVQSGLLKSAEGTKPATVKTRDALVQSFRLNIDYCNQWIAAKDFKSLTKTVGDLPTLVVAINRHTAESDRAKIDAVRKAVDALSAAAKSSEPAAAKSASEELKTALTQLAEAKTLDPPKPIEKISGGFGPLMSLLDGTFADAKTAASVGDAGEAKQSALTLAELGQYLAVDRNDERWRKQSNDLVAAAIEAAAADATDTKSLRKVFHDVYDRCEACHAVRRPNRK